MAKTTKTTKAAKLSIKPLNLGMLDAHVVGVVPIVQLRFSMKTKYEMRMKHEAGSTAKKGKKREKRNFEEQYTEAMYCSPEGWRGIPVGAFRNAMISACRVCGFQMTKAKLTVWVDPHTTDKDEVDVGLVRLYGKPEMVIHHVRNATGVADLRVRAMWRTWKAIIPVRFDADMFTVNDIANLIARVGMQVGIGEGRPDSKTSCGMGWGKFRLVEEKEWKKLKV